MPFISPGDLPRTEIFPDGFSGIVSGKQIMFSFLEMREGSVIPEHSHREEQAGLVLVGHLQLRIGDEERVLEPGQAYIIPSGVAHSGCAADGVVRVLDVFSPPREDYLAKVS